MKRKVTIAIILALIILNIGQFTCNNLMNKLFTDAIPDEETAVIVGKAVLIATYGEDMILSQEPFHARYDERKKYWVVSGTWPDNPNLVGGIGTVFIRKSDGKVIKINHGL